MSQHLFHWDLHNIKHCIEDYPDRNNDQEEIESVFYDQFRIEYYDQIGRFGNDEYICIGKSNLDRVLYIAFEIVDGKIRPFTCIPNNKNAKKLYESNKETRSNP